MTYYALVADLDEENPIHAALIERNSGYDFIYLQTGGDAASLLRVADQLARRFNINSYLMEI